jgi:AraC-like DNA-binding protein/ligand-binding sensor protein
MNRETKQPTSDQRLFLKLLESPLFATYRRAFMNATGMNLELVSTEEDAAAFHRREKGEGSFCQLLNEVNGSSPCAGCLRSCKQLWKSAEDQSQTTTCFAGLRETAIPVRTGQTTVALLTTGQVFTSRPDDDRFDSVKEELTQFGTTPEQIEAIHEAWRKTRVMPVDQYEGTITLLAAFALQLSGLFNRLLLEETHQEPSVVVRAKQFINARLEDRIYLEDVAHQVGVSTFYFCKVFKRTTGLTLTEYVNRRRIERVKHKLLNPQARVTEVAYEVGYQSLSQFNRSFLKYVGVSPTKYREQHLQASKDNDMQAA